MHMNSIELKVPFLGPVTKDKECYILVWKRKKALLIEV